MSDDYFLDCDTHFSDHEPRMWTAITDEVALPALPEVAEHSGQLRLLIGDQDAGLLMLEAARQELQTENRFSNPHPAFDNVYLVRKKAAGAVVDQIDAAGNILPLDPCNDSQRTPFA